MSKRGREEETNEITGEKSSKAQLQRVDIYQRQMSAHNVNSSPLLSAIGSNQPEIVTALLNVGGPIHNFAVERACKVGNKTIVDILVKYGALVHIKSLTTCAKYGHTDLFIYLHQTHFKDVEISFYSVEQAIFTENKKLFDYIIQFPFTIRASTLSYAFKSGPYFSINIQRGRYVDGSNYNS